MSDFLSTRLARVQGSPNEFARAVMGLKRSGAHYWDLSVSNPTAAQLSRDWGPIQSALLAAATDVYAPASLGRTFAREHVASHMARREEDEHGFFDAGVNRGFDASRLMLTASTSDSYAYLFKALCDSGDRILVPEPSYPLLEHLAALEGIRAVPYRLDYDGAWHVDWDSVRVGLASKPKGVVLVTPNNPTASCLTSDEFERFTALGIPLIVDQVFSPFVRRASGGRSLPYHDAGVLTFVLDGLSKRCALPQLKVGWIGVFGPSAPAGLAMSALESIGDTYLGVNSVSEGALGLILDATADTRRLLRARLDGNLKHLERLTAGGAPFSLFHYQGGWTALLRMPNYRSDEEWARLLLERRVVVQPGWLYDCPSAATLVVSLLTPHPVFEHSLGQVLELLADES
jgi:alanine-synthesizing transaminase